MEARITPEQLQADNVFLNGLKTSLSTWEKELAWTEKELIEQSLIDNRQGIRSSRYLNLEKAERELKANIATAKEKLDKVNKRYSGFMTMIVALIAVLCSCQQQDNDVKIFYADPRLEGFYHHFLREASARGIRIEKENVIMIVKPDVITDYVAHGVTIVTPGGQRYIYIDSAWYIKMGAEVEPTVFHEFGHCFLNRQHNNAFSLMNPEVAGQPWPQCNDSLSCNKTYLISELFHTK